jgi:repressor of nif and glnA expression
MERVVRGILKVLGDTDGAIGAARIATRLKGAGLDIQPRTVRAHLLALDQAGMTETVSRRLGRQLTERGRQELLSIGGLTKLGVVAARVDDLGYRMTYRYGSGRGTVVANVAMIRERDLSRALLHVVPVLRAGYSIGDRLAVLRSGEKIGEFTVPLGSSGLATVCSVTINGVLISKGVPVVSRFGGLLEMRQGAPVRFLDMIEYRGTTVDPLEMFIRARMTQVGACARTGNGIVGASFREIPVGAVGLVKRLLHGLRERGLGGDMLLGEPGRSLLDVPVAEGRAGLILIGGLNPLAVLQEEGIPQTTRSLSGLCDIGTFMAVEDAALLGRRRYPYLE